LRRICNSGVVARGKKRRPEKLTFERHLPVTQYSHVLYLLGHSIVSWASGRERPTVKALFHLKTHRRASLPHGRPRPFGLRGARTSPARCQSAPGSSPLRAGAPSPAPAWSRQRAPVGRFRSGRRRSSSAGEPRESGEERTPPARMVLESVARIVKVQLPAYLKRLPVPESITGFARLTVSEWLRLLPFLGVLALLGYLAVRPFLPKKKQQKDSLINLKIQKENPKVVNEINIEDLCLTKAAYCRCWRSKTFPACDGSHNKHNELTGDNVGPLILKKKEV
uniref:Uncharacterized protein n=1 Tax=Ovis aries TaxID=9940 RepID=A0AC11E2S3_SHEEP